MRIPFDITKRPQIESGEYKVIYVEYPSTNQYPVEILKWDSNSDAGCIIGCVRRKGKDRIYAFQENGVHTVSDEDDRLFLVTPEPEMSEFEKRLQEVLFEHATTNSSAEEKAHQYSSELLDIAKKQLLQSGELLTQEHHEKLMETQYKETLDGVKKNWHDYFTPQAVTDIYNAGRNDVLKDLPKWEFYRRGTEIDPFAVVRFKDGTIGRAKYAVDDCYVLEVKDMLKLPGFKEDESHE